LDKQQNNLILTRRSRKLGDAATNLLIEKGVISEAEFKEQLLKERATYQTLLHNAKPQ
jgi:hypothetical protein